MTKRKYVNRFGMQVEAQQWFRDGHHPMVRPFRSPDMPGTAICRHCDSRMDDHGWMKPRPRANAYFNVLLHLVCVGDYIVVERIGGLIMCYPIHSGIFCHLFDEVVEKAKVPA